MCLLSIASATQHLRFQAAYFAPDDLAIGSFVAARKRGVKNKIIVPRSRWGSKILRNASRCRKMFDGIAGTVRRKL